MNVKNSYLETREHTISSTISILTPIVFSLLIYKGGKAGKFPSMLHSGKEKPWRAKWFAKG